MFSPIDIVAPLALGLVADHRGVIAALPLLLLQPVGILVLLTLARRHARHAPKV